MIPSDDHDLLDPMGPDPMAPGQRQPDRLSGVTVGLVGLLAAVAVAAVALFALGGDDDTPADGDQAATTDGDLGSSAGESGTDPTEDAGIDAGAEAGAADGTGADGANESDPGQDPADPAGATAEGSASTTNTPTTAQDGSAGASPTTATAGGTTASTNGATSDTVEDDETTDDPDDSDPTADPNGDPNSGANEGGTPGPTPTASTLPAPTSGSCPVAATSFDGRSGVVELGTDGACGALSATIQAVNPRDDLAGSDWARDIRVCQRHPAAGEVAIQIRTGAETIELTEGWSRSAAEAVADPIEAITITFSNQATPETGPRPVVLCRTDTAELSIVHRPAA